MKVTKLLPCGHTANVECSKDVAAVTCRLACGHVMSCGHPCGGDCTQCLWGRMHIGCRQLCRRPLVCNHSCGNYCCGVCPPCQRPCETHCVHSKCPKPCGEPCTPCIKPCAWVCEHYRCTLPCNEPCNRPPCNRRCRKFLPCRHRCVGVCGETCPPLCRSCNRDELCELFFGTEDEDDALFVYLEDCGHVLEVTGLDQWVNISNKSKEAAIQPKECPRCGTAIRKNLRYGKAVNASSKDIQGVKQKAFEERSRFHRDRHKILLEIGSINVKVLSLQWQNLIDDFKAGNTPLPNQSLADIHTLLNTLKAIQKTKHDVMVKLERTSHQYAIVCQLQSLTFWVNDCPGRFHSEVAGQLDAEGKRLELLIKELQKLETEGQLSYNQMEKSIKCILEKTIGKTRIKTFRPSWGKETETIKALRKDLREKRNAFNTATRKNKNKHESMKAYIQSQAKLKEGIEKEHRENIRDLAKRISKEGGTKSQLFWKQKKNENNTQTEQQLIHHTKRKRPPNRKPSRGERTHSTVLRKPIPSKGRQTPVCRMG